MKTADCEVWTQNAPTNVAQTWRLKKHCNLKNKTCTQYNYWYIQYTNTQSTQHSATDKTQNQHCHLEIQCHISYIM